jgi:hypothetical protein
MRSTCELWTGPNYTSRPYGPPSLRNPFLLGPAFISSLSDLVRGYQSSGISLRSALRLLKVSCTPSLASSTSSQMPCAQLGYLYLYPPGLEPMLEPPLPRHRLARAWFRTQPASRPLQKTQPTFPPGQTSSQTLGAACRGNTAPGFRMHDDSLPSTWVNSQLISSSYRFALFRTACICILYTCVSERLYPT